MGVQSPRRMLAELEDLGGAGFERPPRWEMLPRLIRPNAPSSRPVVLTVVFLLVLLGAYALLDYVMGISLLWPWMFGGLALGFGLGLLGTIDVRPRARIALLLFFSVLFVGLRWVNWNSRKPFLRDLYSLRVGMTRSQVEATMGKYLKGTGWPANTVTDSSAKGELAFPGTLVYRHTNEGWGDSDWGMVEFAGGRVIRVEFSPD
jgi:hypothetical protein